jgi:hypothetical protein
MSSECPLGGHRTRPLGQIDFAYRGQVADSPDKCAFEVADAPQRPRTHSFAAGGLEGAVRDAGFEVLLRGILDPEASDLFDLARSPCKGGGRRSSPVPDP